MKFFGSPPASDTIRAYHVDIAPKLHLGRAMRFAREQAILLLVIAMGLSLLLGISVGLGLGDFVIAPPTWTTPTGPTFLPTATPLVTPTPDASQISVVLLAVDSLQSPHPQLEAFWLVTFKPDALEYYLLGVPPTTTVTLRDSSTYTLREIHLLDVNQNLQNLFMRDAALALLPDINTPKAVITFDRALIVRTIDLLNGLTIAGQHYSGEAAMQAYESLPYDSAARLEWQTAILLGLLRAARDQGHSPASLLALLHLGQTWYPSYEAMQEIIADAPAFQATGSTYQQDQFVPFLFETPTAAP